MPLRASTALAAVVLAALAFPSAPLGDELDRIVTNELGVGSGKSSAQAPRSGQVTDTLSATFGLAEQWTLDLSAGVTAVSGTKGVVGQEFGTRGGNVFSFSSGLGWAPMDQLDFDLELSYSPRTKLLTDTTLMYSPTAGQVVATDALLSVHTSTRGARLSAAYETPGESFKTRFELEGAYTRYDADQHVVATRDPTTGASVSNLEYLTYCRATNTCSPQLLALLRDEPTPLDQTELLLGVTETLYDDTDLGLSAAYYLYGQDPAGLGFFGLVSRSGFRSGLPLAPFRWSLRPEAARRFGDLTVRLWYQHGVYVDDEGTSELLGARLQYRIARSFKVALTASGQRDKDFGGAVSTFNQAALGVTWLF